MKINFENPKNIKLNMAKTINEFKDEIDENLCNNKDFNKILYSLVLMHSIIQKRGNYGTIGWNFSY